MIQTLRNAEFEVKIKAKGAEMCSFKRLSDNTEYIWQGDAKIWPRHAPVLFPIVGRLPEHKYFLDGKSYHLPQHGFARDMIFETTELTDTSVTLTLHESEISLAHYPYRFQLTVTFTLQQNSVAVSYQVQNSDNKTLPFSIGAHPGFNCPLSDENKFEDYYLEFEENQTLDRHLLQEGLLNGQTETVLQDGQKLAINRDLFLKDALVVKQNKIEKVRLRSDKDNRQVEMQFSGFPYLGIWSPPKDNATLICIEPWHGVTGNAGQQTELLQKEGLIQLPAGEQFSCSYQIAVS